MAWIIQGCRPLLPAMTLLLLVTQSAQAQMGHVLDGVGPVNQSMGGAGTALPLDAIGSVHWNPASIRGLRRSEIGFGFSAFLPKIDLESSVTANGFGPGIPGQPFSGVTSSESEVSPIPSLALVFQPPNSPWTFGLGGLAIGGFGVDFPASRRNPILTPQRPYGGMGFGPIYSEYQLMQFSPTVAREILPGLSIGVAPTMNWSRLSIAPFSATTPNPDGSYPSGANGDTAWGLGFQVGVFYESPETGWNFGVSYKSTQWFEEFSIMGMDHRGAPRRFGIDLDYPAILSLGVAYQGFERVKWACDVRYIDYENTDGFQTAGFDRTGAVTGFGWSSIWSVSNGLEFTLSENCRWRIGYTYNQSPIDGNTIFYNSPAPALVQHHLSTGFTFDLYNFWEVSVTYKHGFRNKVSGNWKHPQAGDLRGTNISAELGTHSLTVGVSKSF